jgi:Holliday junction resolvase RusA-like endonuclease
VILNDTIVPNKKRERRKRSLDEPEISADNADAAATVGEEKPNQKTRRQSKAKSSEPEAPAFWFNSTDHFSLVLGSGQQLKQQPRSVRFSVRGSPRPLRRHRTARGFMYNPSSKYQTSFRQVVHQLVWPDVETESDNHEPLFAEDDQLAMTLVFYMKRPKKHFVSGKPGPGRLRDEAPPRLSPSRTDVDNLAKFVLDSLNGLLYVDDRQVASIQATKLLHDDGECEGCTHVSIYRLTDQDLDALLEPTIPPGR